ncbi:MAG: hypothetical protein K8R92_09815 [Planctomycetes bacterium]|nr:hypothetical protein [Planctomycetota bacterium]
MSTTPLKILCSFTAGVALFCAARSEAGFYISTGQMGAQVQCDTNHTQSWTFHVTQDVSDVMGASLVMKRGSQTSAGITFRINEITLNDDVASATTLLSVTLGSSAFSQQFNNVVFQAAPITLRAGHTYTAVLSSTAPNQQSKAYFIKRADLSWTDAGGSATTTSGFIEPGAAPVPAPGAALLLAFGVMNHRRRVIA